MDCDQKTVLAYKAAKDIVINGEKDIFDKFREDLFNDEQEWVNLVNFFIPTWEQWKKFLNSQNYKEGDFVIRASRMIRYSVSHLGDPPLDHQEIEDRFIYPTVSFLGKIQSFIPDDRQGSFRYAVLICDYDTPCQSRYDDLIILSDEQYQKALNGKITCDELKLPIFQFNYESSDFKI